MDYEAIARENPNDIARYYGDQDVKMSLEELVEHYQEDVKDKLNGLAYFHVFKDDSILVTNDDNSKYAIIKSTMLKAEENQPTMEQEQPQMKSDGLEPVKAEDCHSFLVVTGKGNDLQPYLLVDHNTRVRDFMEVMHPDVDIDALKADPEQRMRLVGITMPIDKVMMDYKYITTGEENMKYLLEREKEFRIDVKAIQLGLSQAELVLNHIQDGQKPTIDQAFTILKGIDDEFKKGREPHFELDDKGNEKKGIMIFNDGSKLDLRGETMLADRNVDQRVEALGRKAALEFSDRIKPEYEQWKDYARELYRENREIFERHKVQAPKLTR